MRRPDLLSQLVAAPGHLAMPHPGGTVVAPMGAPPANMRFGPLSPGITTSQRFTGGAVGHPLSPVHPAPPGFAPPSYAAVPGSGMRTAPVLAALAASGAIAAGAPAGGTPGIGPTSLPPPGPASTPAVSHPSTSPPGLPPALPSATSYGPQYGLDYFQQNFQPTVGLDMPSKPSVQSGGLLAALASAGRRFTPQ